jgi:protein-tyrosine phosphatase
MDQVADLLLKNHGSNFMVFNLSERRYEAKKMNHQSTLPWNSGFGNIFIAVIYYPFVDHHPPPFFQYFQIIITVDAWLQADEKNVAVVHCIGTFLFFRFLLFLLSLFSFTFPLLIMLGGKGRTGCVIGGVMFFGGFKDKMSDCIDYFANKRSKEGKGKEKEEKEGKEEEKEEKRGGEGGEERRV